MFDGKFKIKRFGFDCEVRLYRNNKYPLHEFILAINPNVLGYDAPTEQLVFKDEK